MSIEPPDAPNAPSRAFWTLTRGETVAAVAGAFVVWYGLYCWVYRTTDDVWQDALNRLPWEVRFIFFAVGGASAVCALRFVRGGETRAVSRMGYLAFAFPALQAALGAVWVSTLNTRPDLGFSVLIPALVLSALAHFCLSVVVSLRGFWAPRSRGDLAALPAFIAWQYLLTTISFFGNYNGLFDAPSP